MKKRIDINFYDVFISWTGADHMIKNQLKDYLENKGIRCLESDEKCCGDFRQWSREAIKHCTVFLLIYTKSILASEYVPIEIEEYKRLDDYENRIVPVCNDKSLYFSDVFGIKNFASAVFVSDETLSNEQLKRIFHSVKSLIVNRMDKTYRNEIEREYMKITPLYTTKSVMSAAYNYSNLYIKRTLEETSFDENIFEHFTSSEKLLLPGEVLFIYGEAGCGKTNYIRQLHREAPENAIVISVQCGRTTLHDRATIFEVLYDEFVSKCGNGMFCSVEDFKSIVKSRHLIMVFDGMDEIATRSGTEKLISKIEEYAAHNPDNITIIFTGRNKGDASLISINGKKPRLFKLEELSEEQIQSLSSNLFYVFGNHDKSAEFYMCVKDLSKEIKANPLLLSQLALVYDTSGNIPKTIVEIYDKVCEITLNIENTKLLQDIPGEYTKMLTIDISAILKSFARERYELLSMGEQQEPTNILAMVLKKQFNYNDYRQRAEFLSEYLENRSFIVSGEFYHKMFLEYYTAVCYYEESFDCYNRIESSVIIEELFSHYNETYWNSVIKLFLIKADNLINNKTTEQLYRLITKIGITEYTLLFEVCRDLISNSSVAQKILCEDILKKSAMKLYPPYGPLFWYVPYYELYEQVLLSLTNLKNDECYTCALALVRDVCYMFGQKNHIDEISTEVDGYALYEVSDKKQLRGIRNELCRLFYLGQCDGTVGKEVYPRCFNPAEAVSFKINGYGLYGRYAVPFEDELNLYSHEDYPKLNNEYIGVMSFPNDVKKEVVLNAYSGKKISAIILSPTDDTKLRFISFNRRGVKLIYIPENINGLLHNWNIYFNLIQAPCVCNDGILYHRNILFLPGLSTNIEKIETEGGIVKCIHMSDSIESLMWFAFDGYANLQKLNVSKRLTNISAGMFRCCESLEEILIPDSVTDIYPEAFCGCVNLKKIKLPQYLKELDPYVFEECESIEELEIPAGVEKIGELCFFGCISLKQIIIPESVTEIEFRCFKNCKSLTSIFLPKNLQVICIEAFANCNQLRCLEIPDSVRIIEAGAFRNCSLLERIRIPESIEEIGENAFEGCVNLKEITNLPDTFNPIFCGVGENTGVTFKKNCGKINRAEERIVEISPCSVETSPELIIPEDVVQLEPNAYNGNSFIEKVQMPESVRLVGEKAFAGCEKLVEAIFLNELTQMERGVFMDDISLTKIYLPQKLENIAMSMFENCTSIEQIDIPPTVKGIGSNAFRGCKTLKTFVFPEILYNLGSGVFENCKSLTDIHLPEKLTYINPNTFSGCTALKKIYMPNVKRIGAGVFENCINIEEITLPDCLEDIGEMAFCGCLSLKSVNIPNNVRYIGDGAFYNTKQELVRLSVRFESDVERIFCECKPKKILFI